MKARDGDGGAAVPGMTVVVAGRDSAARSGGAGGSLHQGRRRGDDAGPVRGAGVAVADLDARAGAHELGVDQADLAGWATVRSAMSVARAKLNWSAAGAAAWAPWGRRRARGAITAVVVRVRRAVLRITSRLLEE